MKLKLAKEYSLLLTLVMVFNLFVPVMVSANGDNTEVTLCDSQNFNGSDNMACCELADGCNLINEKLTDKEDTIVDQTGNNRELANLKEAAFSTDMNFHESWSIFKINKNKLNYDVDCSNDGMTDDEYSDTYSKSADDEEDGRNENINGMDTKKYEDNAYANKNCSEKNINKRDYVVRFCSNVGNDAGIYDQQIVKEGDLVKQITDPERAEYIFGGWYCNENCSGNPYNFNDPVLRDFTLYAKWIKKEQLSETKLLKNGISFTEKNDFTKLFRINKNVSSRLNTYPVKPRNSIARFRRLGNVKPQNANNILMGNSIFRLLPKNMDLFNIFKVKKDVKIKEKRQFSNDLDLDNPKTGDMEIIMWIGFMVASVMGFIIIFNNMVYI